LPVVATIEPLGYRRSSDVAALPVSLAVGVQLSDSRWTRSSVPPDCCRIVP